MLKASVTQKLIQYQCLVSKVVFCVVSCSHGQFWLAFCLLKQFTAVIRWAMMQRVSISCCHTRPHKKVFSSEATRHADGFESLQEFWLEKNFFLLSANNFWSPRMSTWLDYLTTLSSSCCEASVPSWNLILDSSSRHGESDMTQFDSVHSSRWRNSTQPWIKQTHIYIKYRDGCISTHQKKVGPWGMSDDEKSFARKFNNFFSCFVCFCWTNNETIGICGESRRFSNRNTGT